MVLKFRKVSEKPYFIGFSGDEKPLFLLIFCA
jgi:hypothetical protein